MTRNLQRGQTKPMHVEGVKEKGQLARKLKKQLTLSQSKEGPAYVCVSCHRFMYRQNVLILNRDLKLIDK